MDLENILAKNCFCICRKKVIAGNRMGINENVEIIHTFFLFEIPSVERNAIAQKVIVLDRNDNIHETFKRM